MCDSVEWLSPAIVPCVGTRVVIKLMDGKYEIGVYKGTAGRHAVTDSGRCFAWDDKVIDRYTVLELAKPVVQNGDSWYYPPDGMLCPLAPERSGVVEFESIYSPEIKLGFYDTEDARIKVDNSSWYLLGSIKRWRKAKVLKYSEELEKARKDIEELANCRDELNRFKRLVDNAIHSLNVAQDKLKNGELKA